MSKQKQAEAVQQGRSVAYHDGPPEIQYAGRAWRRGVAQPVTNAEWEAMQARADFAPFQFKPDAPAPAISKE